MIRTLVRINFIVTIFVVFSRPASAQGPSNVLAVLTQSKTALVTVIAVQEHARAFLEDKTDPNTTSSNAPVSQHRPVVRRTVTLRETAGVCLSEEGWIATSVHGIHQADRIWVRFTDGSSYPARPRRLMPDMDVALLSIENEPRDRPFPFVDIDPTPLRLGQEVFTLGRSPLLSGTISAGKVVGLARTAADSGRVVFVLLDFDHYPGDSGGPVFNRKGALVGLLSRRERSGRHRVLAYPAAFIKTLIDEEHHMRTSEASFSSQP